MIPSFQCHLCSLTGTSLEEDDNIRKEVKHLVDKFTELNGQNDNDTESANILEDIFRCFARASFPASTKWVFYVSGFHVNKNLGHSERAKFCLETALNLLEVSKGSSCKEYKQLLAKQNLFK